MLYLGILIGVILGVGTAILLSRFLSPGNIVVWEDPYGEPPTLTLELSREIGAIRSNKFVTLMVKKRTFSQK